MYDVKTFAFIDEYGNSSLETTKEGTSEYFIVCAVVVSEKNIDKLRNHAEQIRKQYFQTGEMKSSGVGNNDNRRIKILNSISEMDFKFYALCVEKESIIKDSGLRFKKPSLNI